MRIGIISDAVQMSKGSRRSKINEVMNVEEEQEPSPDLK